MHARRHGVGVERLQADRLQGDPAAGEGGAGLVDDLGQGAGGGGGQDVQTGGPTGVAHGPQAAPQLLDGGAHGGRERAQVAGERGAGPGESRLLGGHDRPGEVAHDRVVQLGDHEEALALQVLPVAVGHRVGLPARAAHELGDDQEEAARTP